MQDIIDQVFDLLRGAWRFRWVAVATAWLIAIGGWTGVQFMPDKYTSHTKVYVDTESLLRPLLSGLAVDRDVMSQVAMMQSVMLSRPNLEKVAQQTDLMLGAGTRREKEAIIDSLAQRVSLGRASVQGGGSAFNTFQLAFTDNSPKVAHGVVRALLDTFMEDSLGLKRSDTGVAQRFLESQIREYEQKLVEAEDRLARFKQENVGSMPGSGGDYYSRLESETNTLQQHRQNMAQLQMRRDELARQVSGEEPTLGLMGASEGSPIDGQIARFKAQRDQLLLQYTEKHPQVQSLNDTIARLEEEKRGGAKVSSQMAASSLGLSKDEAMVRSIDMNPVYQSLRLSLSQTDADLAAVRGQVRAQEAVVAELRTKIAAIPKVEADMARLNRDYEVIRGNYDTLVQRLESARISESAEQSTENVKFRVLEPPLLPVRPSGPDRMMLNTMVLVAGFGIGLGLAVLLAQFNPTFATRNDLHRVTGVPVIGVITTAVQQSVVPWYRRQGVMIGAAVSVLLITFVLNMRYTEALRAALRASAG